MNKKGQKPARILDNRKAAGSMNQPLHCNQGENSVSEITTAAHLVLQAVSLQPSKTAAWEGQESMSQYLPSVATLYPGEQEEREIAENLVIFLRFC